MNPIIIIFLAASIIWVFCLFYLRGFFEKISWRFLISFLVLSRVFDGLFTILYLEKINHDYSKELNSIVRWMLVNINLPDVVVLFIHAIVWVGVISFFFWFIYQKYKKTRIAVKVSFFVFSLTSFVVSLWNFSLYLSN